MIALPFHAQDRFQSGEFRGFTISPTEHNILELDKKFTVRTAKGVVVRDVDGFPLSNVIFEIRGPDDSEKIRGVKTNNRGQFKIKHVPRGTYLFKVTMRGYRSVVGTIVVSKKAERHKRIEIKMPLGG